MQTHRLLVGISIVIVLGCSAGDTAGPGNWLTHRLDTPSIYSHDLFPSPGACTAARAMGYENCQQWVELCPDGRAILVVTDIGNSGTYELRGSKLILTIAGQEWSGEIVFDVSADGRRLTERDSHGEWLLNEGYTPAFCGG